MMEQDEIMKEVREIRESYAAKFDYDIDGIFDDIMRRQREREEKADIYPPRRPKRHRKTVKTG